MEDNLLENLNNGMIDISYIQETPCLPSNLYYILFTFHSIELTYQTYFKYNYEEDRTDFNFIM
jgi:hypothetical protein